MIITIPFKTPTINHLHGFRGHFQYLKKDAVELKKKIKEIVEEQKPIIPRDSKLAVLVDVYENWYYKNGKVKKVDVANREKFLIDSVFEALGIDDKWIWVQQMTKMQSEGEEKSVLHIQVI